MSPAAFGALLLLGCGAVWAAQPGEPLPPSLSVSPLASMLQVMLGLAVVLAALAGAVWLLRRYATGQSGAGGAVKVIGGVLVGPKERVVLVEVGDTWLVLGVGAGQVNALHSMAKPPHASAFPATQSPTPGFSAWLKDALQRRKGG